MQERQAIYQFQNSLLVEPAPAHAPSPARAPTATHAADLAPADLTDVVREYCVRCHNARRLTGNLTLEGFDIAGAPQHAEIGEKMILKLRAGMMPPPGARRPAGDTLRVLAETLEALIDEDWARSPNPGSRSFQRLNRAESNPSAHRSIMWCVTGFPATRS